MSRTKGPSAQPGPQRWRQQPEQDVNAYPEDHYAEPPQTRPNGSPHFPQHAFRNLNNERTAPPAPMQRTTFQRPHTVQQAPGGHDRLSQRLQHTDPRTSDQWPTQPDPSAYDLAHYAPEQPGHGRGAPIHDPYAQQSYMDAAAEGWTGNGWNGQAQGYAEPMDGAHYGDPNDQDYGYDADEDAPAPRRGPRSYVVVGALVGAIAAGGALAYVYKSLGRGGVDSATPVVRAERVPAKAKPADPGGKEMAHTDKKFINRLTDDKSGGSQRFGEASAALATPDNSTAGSTESDGAPRRVTTLTVNRDGSMAPPNPSVPLSQNSGTGLSGAVPGMVIDGLNASPQRPQLRGSAVPVENQAVVPAKPQNIAKASPAPEPPQRAPQKPIQREETAAAAPPSGRSAVAAPAAASNGFVAVLSSQKSRMDALKAFADMQQKYSDTLQNRTPDVREVDLGDKGVWHRLVVGPPASREAASGVCMQLKAQGYSGCWVVAY
jgi:cell division septation protein DedD